MIPLTTLLLYITKTPILLVRIISNIYFALVKIPSLTTLLL